MATGISLSTDIVANAQYIYQGALHTLYEQNVLGRTVSTYTGQGMQGRKVTQYTAANIRQAGEGEDVTPTIFSDALLSTLTPARYADTFLLTDQMVDTSDAANMVNVRADAALELGSNFAQYIDTQIASNFSSLTGGTVGTAGSTLTWQDIFAARAILQAAKVPGPYTCALHPYQWNDLVQATLTTGNELQNAPGFVDAMVSTYFVASIMGGVTFAISANTTFSSTNTYGAMYPRLAMALDIRRPFNIRPQRDESREAWELNASIWFAHGVWAPARGVQIISDATTPA